MANRSALVTGGSRGIGAATARRLAEDGFDVAVNFLHADAKAREVVASIEAAGRRGVAVRADVARSEEVRRMVEETVRTFGRLDVLVNNAGVYDRTSFDRITPDDWDRRLATNLHGCFYAAKAAVPHLRAAGGGAIVGITSQLAFRGSDHGADYVAAKAGLVGLTKALAMELAKDRIRVNAVAPGSIETDILAGDTPEIRDRRLRTIPLRRIGKPEEIAAAVSFLVSPDASYITGQVLHVNGGALMW